MLTLRGGILEGKTLTGEEIEQLATLPPLDVLRGQLVGVIVAPLTQLLALVSAPLQNLHGLIDARIKQLEEQGEVVEPAAEVRPESAASRRPSAEAEAPEPEADTEAEAVSGRVNAKSRRRREAEEGLTRSGAPRRRKEEE